MFLRSFSACVEMPEGGGVFTEIKLPVMPVAGVPLGAEAEVVGMSSSIGEPRLPRRRASRLTADSISVRKRLRRYSAPSEQWRHSFSKSNRSPATAICEARREEAVDPRCEAPSAASVPPASSAATVPRAPPGSSEAAAWTREPRDFFRLFSSSQPSEWMRVREDVEGDRDLNKLRAIYSRTDG